MISEWFKIIIAVITGLIGGWLGHWFAVWRGNMSKRLEFQSFISQKQGMVPDVGFLDFYNKSWDEIRERVFGVLPYLSLRQREQIKITLARYEALKEQSLNNESTERNECMAEAMRKDGQTPPPDQIASFRKCMEDFRKSSQ